MRTFVFVTAILLLCSSGISKEYAKNFVLIVADDLTYTDTSLYGGQAATPNLERLASEGMRFDNCFQAAPMCSPTRHNLYTGLYPVHSGAWPNHTYVYPGVKSIAHYLQESGYRAGFSGKTHINPDSAFPFEFVSRKIKNTNPDFEAVDEFLSECQTEETPFGLILCSNEPHTPWNKGDASAYPPSKLELPPVLADTPKTRENFSRYLAEITYFDSQVGQALELLDKHGLAGDTVVLVVTEQGNAFPFAKWTCYDKGLGSGLVVRWPNVVTAGSSSQALVEYNDVVPTLLEALDLPNPGNLDGKSFVEVLTQKSDHHQDYVYGLQTSTGIHNGPGNYGIRSIRDERYRYIRNLTPEIEFTNAATKTNWWREWEEAAQNGDKHARELVNRYQHRPAIELYDCWEDPWNLNNLAKDPTLSGKLKELETKLDSWMLAQNDQGAKTERDAEQRLWRNAPHWENLLDEGLSKWEIWMGVPHPTVDGLPPETPTAVKPQDGKPLGLNNDPKEVFRVIQDGTNLVLGVSGEIYAGLTSKSEYANYHFSAEVKWGEKKWEPRLDRKRDSGFLYHCTGPHGAFWNVWKRCVEFQIQEGDFGDLYMLAGTGGTLRVIENQDPQQGQARYIWNPSGESRKIGRVQRSKDFESPQGEWTHIEVYTLGNQAIHLVNGQVVLAIDEIRYRDNEPLSRGQLQLQSEGAEVYYRDIKIRPIKEFPKNLKEKAQF